MSNGRQAARDRWRHRRRMAYVAFAVLNGFTVGIGVRLFWFGDDPNSWVAIASMTIGSLAGIVLAYTGAATYDQVTQRRIPHPDERPPEGQ